MSSLTSPQTAYTVEQPPGIVGQLADLSDRHVVSAANAEGDSIPVGIFVREETAPTAPGDAHQITEPTTALQRLLGLVLHSHNFDTTGIAASSEDLIRDEEVLDVLRRGRAFVEPEVDVSAFDRVFVRITATGSEQLGAVRNDEDDGDAIMVPGCRFVTGSDFSAGVLAIMSVNMDVYDELGIGIDVTNVGAQLIAANDITVETTGFDVVDLTTAANRTNLRIEAPTSDNKELAIHNESAFDFTLHQTDATSFVYESSKHPVLNAGDTAVLRSDLNDGFWHVVSGFQLSDVPDTVTDTAALSLLTKTSHLVTTTGAVPTLADGFEGQKKRVVMETFVGVAVLTPATPGGFTAIYFDGIEDAADLLFSNAAWQYMGGKGVEVTGVPRGVQLISGPGAIDVINPETVITTTGDPDAFTLANGINGQRKRISLGTDGGEAIITPATPFRADENGYLWNPVNLALNKAKAHMLLKWIDSAWVVLEHKGNDRRVEFHWIAGDLGIPGLNADITPASADDAADGATKAELDLMNTMDPRFEMIGTSMTSALVTYDDDGGIRMTLAGGAADSAILQPHLNAKQSGWTGLKWSTDRLPSIEAEIVIADAMTDAVQWFGIKLTNTDATGTDADQAYFRAENGVSTGNWVVENEVGGALVETDTGVAATAAATAHLKIVTDSIRVTRYYINGNLVATGAALTSLDTMEPYFGLLDGGSGVALFCKIRSMHMSREAGA